MASAGLMVSLPQMVDLAIGSPECGAVNFNLLSAALQVIIQQLNLNEYVVDFRGPDVERIQNLISTAKPGLSLKISEAVDTEAGTVPSDRRQSEEVSKTEPRRNSKEEPQAGSVGRTEKVIVVEPSSDRRISNVPHIVVGVSQELFLQINQDVDDLKNKMAEILELPNNETIIEAVRAQGQDKVTPVIDMWQALSIAKRVESAETGMEKLAGMMENLIHDIGGAKDDGGVNIFADINSKIEALEQRIEEGGGGGGGGPKPEGDGNDNADEGGASGEIENLKTRLKTLETDVANALKGTKGKNFAELFKDVDELKSKSGGGEATEAEVGVGGGTGLDEATVNELQENFNEFANKLNNLDETLSMQINKLQEQLLNIEKELGALLESANTKNDTNADSASVGDLFNKIVKLQEELENLSKITDRINEEQEERTLTIEALQEQVELMKTTKADREDLEDALADKADNQQVNRKVSTIQFDAACEDLTRHIEDTVKKLTEQEELWQSTLDELHMTIGAKLDKQEFDPLRDFVNRKIKSLQQRLKALLAMKQEQEAAGTKSKILKNVNCISCDKDVIMYKENKFSTFPTPQSMPVTRSIKPYITYELDAVRKQQKSLPQGRNMNNLETAMHDEKAKKMSTDKPVPAGHLCNRYCGGSHTMTQPQQRVAHLGHFLNQWGPQAIALDEGHIMGTDGQMYKARDASGDAPKSTAEEIRRLSAQMQTDEPKERVQRLSSTLEAIKRERSSRLSKLRTSSKQVTVEGDQLEPVKEESERGDDGEKKKSTSRLSVRKSARKSSASAPKTSPSQEDKARRSSAKNAGSPRQSQRKSQVSLKRLSQAAPKESTPPREGEEGAAEEKPAEGEEPAAPAPEPAEAPAEAAEGAETPPAENPEEPPAD